jgi:hypothetical protein
MKLFAILTLIIICLINKLNSQNQPFHFKNIDTLELVTDSLPSLINESSGLIFYRNKLWTHNDSGNEPKIYAIDTLGSEIIQTITVENAQNIDWEDICQDNNYIYIGDFGNNYGQRNLLTIYKIKKTSIPNTGNCKVKAEIIQFSYLNMPLAGAIPQRSAYDCEAMVCFNDTLVIFSKNWQKPICNVYCIPAKAGKYNISPSETIKLEGLVTSASLSPDGQNLVLLGYKNFVPFVLLIQNFSLNNISIRKSIFKLYDSQLGFQTEGIAFSSPTKAYISCEKHKYRPNSLFTINFK